MTPAVLWEYMDADDTWLQAELPDGWRLVVETGAFGDRHVARVIAPSQLDRDDIHDIGTYGRVFDARRGAVRRYLRHLKDGTLPECGESGT